MKIFATTDTHFGHEMLVSNGYRDAGYEEKILKSISREKGDLFIHTGDICIGKDEYWHEELNKATVNFTKKVLVRGNHDGKSYSWYLSHGWDMVVEYMQMKIDGKEVLFSHIPLLVEDIRPTLYNNPILNVHGHLHGKGTYSHRKVDGYDGVFNYDIAPDIHGMGIVNINNLIGRLMP